MSTFQTLRTIDFNLVLELLLSLMWLGTSFLFHQNDFINSLKHYAIHQKACKSLSVRFSRDISDM